MDSITQAIESAQADLITTRDRVRETRELLAALEQDAKDIELELAGFRSYARRNGLATSRAPRTLFEQAAGQGGDVVPISPNVDFGPEAHPDILTMSRNEAVATVMSMMAGATDRSAIHEHCALAGRDDSLDDISLSLTGLKRADRVEKLGRGMWRLVEVTPATGS